MGDFLGRIELDPEQEAAVERMVNEPTRAALNGSLYGTGKTVVTVEVAQRVAPEGVKLIVAPLHTKRSWESTIIRQYPDQRVSFINSLKSGQKALQNFSNAEPGWYIVGREYLMTKKMREIVVKLGSKVDFMAYDECQRWANHKSQGFTWMKRFKPGYKMALSATPAGNKFSGMFAIHQWLWPQMEGHRSFWTWANKWCIVEEDYFAGSVVTGEKNPGEFVKALPCYIRLEKDFGEPVHEQIVIDLSTKERRIYDSNEKTLIAWLGEHPLVVKLPMIKRMRLRQATLGEISYDAASDTVYYDDEMKSSKYDALKSWINDHPDEPMLILTHSAKFAMVVATKLINDGYRALPWTGEVPETVRHNVKTAFENGDLDYIVATIPAIGEGVDGLQYRSRMMVWLSRDDSMILNEQAFRRLHRRGQARTVVSVDIVAKDTYDEGQLSTLIQRAIDMNRSLKK